MKSEVLLKEIKSEFNSLKKKQTIKMILFIITAITAVGLIAILIIMKFKNSFKSNDPDELSADDYIDTYYDDDDLMYSDFSDYDSSEEYDDDK